MGHLFLFVFLVLGDTHRKQLCTLSNNPGEIKWLHLFLAYLAYVAAGNTAVCVPPHITYFVCVSACVHQ